MRRLQIYSRMAIKLSDRCIRVVVLTRPAVGTSVHLPLRSLLYRFRRFVDRTNIIHDMSKQFDQKTIFPISDLFLISLSLLLFFEMNACSFSKKQIILKNDINIPLFSKYYGTFSDYFIDSVLKFFDNHYLFYCYYF